MKHIGLCLLIIISISKTSLAQNWQYYSVDIPNGRSLACVQKQTAWCWAACNQMLLSAIGIQESQENQVTRLFGQLVNSGAGSNYERARSVLSGQYNANGNIVTITPYVSYLADHRADDPIVIINHLSNGIPVIMATVQHGRVCIGVDYATDGSNYQITKMRLIDPFPSKPRFVEIPIGQLVNQGLIGFMTYDAQ